MSELVTLHIVSSHGSRQIRLNDQALYAFSGKRDREYELRRLYPEEVVLANYKHTKACIRGDADKPYSELFFKKHAGLASRFETRVGEHKFEPASAAFYTQLYTLGRSTGPRLAIFRPKKHSFFWRGSNRGYIKLLEPSEFLVDGQPSAFLDDAIIYFYAYLMRSTKRYHEHHEIEKDLPIAPEEVKTVETTTLPPQ